MSDDRPHTRGRVRAADDSARIRFRRALALMFLTLLLPGSAQLVVGNKRVGRAAVRISLLLWVVVLSLVLLVFTSRSSVFTLITSPTVLWAARGCVVVLALGWAALFIDAWRLGAPLELRRGHRLAMTGVNSVLCFVTAGSMFFGAHILSVQQDFIGTVFGSGTVSAAEHGRYNVLLLGGDSGADRVGLRPDSLTVASIDKETGRTVLIALPRNLDDVPFSAGSPMHKKFPDGFDCEGCYLNAVNTWAETHKELFPGQKHPGLEATKSTIEEITGLKINYYAMVNLRGFRELVDAVGGVRIHVSERVPIGGVGAPITGYVPAGTHTLNGKQTLWFARSRVNNDDYSRMARQKCVMSAMLNQLSPQKVVLNVQKIAESSKQMLRTDIPTSELDTFMELALKARDAKVSTVSIVPPAINTSDPDFDKIRTMVRKGIDKAERDRDERRARHVTHEKSAGGDPGNDDEKVADVNGTENLEAAC